MSHRQQNQLIQSSFYDVLGVPQNATDTDIKAAYRRLAFQLHPDRHAHTSIESEQHLKLINEAYSKLKTRASRDQYNQILRLQGKAAALSRLMPNSSTWGRFWNWLIQLEKS